MLLLTLKVVVHYGLKEDAILINIILQHLINPNAWMKTNHPNLYLVKMRKKAYLPHSLLTSEAKLIP